jgi:hypothetical protein
MAPSGSAPSADVACVFCSDQSARPSETERGVIERPPLMGNFEDECFGRETRILDLTSALELDE